MKKKNHYLHIDDDFTQQIEREISLSEQLGEHNAGSMFRCSLCKKQYHYEEHSVEHPTRCRRCNGDGTKMLANLLFTKEEE